MPVASSDLVLYGAASRPVDDASTVGGAIAATVRFLDAQFSAAARPEIVSTAAGDTMNVTITGRLADGSIVTEVKALNGTTPVLFDATFERLHSVVAASAVAGTVTVKQGTGGTTRHTLAAGETEALMWFRRAVSDSSPVTRHEKGHVRNNHGSLALTAATVRLTADAGDLYRIGIDPSQNSSLSATNRLTAPAGVTFVDDAVDINVSGTDLGSGDAIGVWAEQTLGADEAPGKNGFSFQIAGQTVA